MDWKEDLHKIIVDKKQNINELEYFQKHVDEIEGIHRDSKRKKFRRYYAACLDELKPKEEKQKKEPVFENLEPNKIELNIKPNTTIKFGVISDTHFNSKYCQITYLHNFYDICKAEGIKTVYHVGDIDDGENMRPGHAYENYKQGADEHISEIVKNYPYREGIKTKFICGNHDSSFRKHCGLDIGTQIAAKRPDMEYLGRDVVVANITDKITMQLRHPWSGSAYALSYRPQKIVESFECNVQNKPDIICIGHFHKMEYLYYHGVHVLQTGCFQAPTPFTEGKGISTAVGGWIITLEIDSNGEILAFTPKAIPYKEFIKDDYKNFI